MANADKMAGLGDLPSKDGNWWEKKHLLKLNYIVLSLVMFCKAYCPPR